MLQRAWLVVAALALSAGSAAADDVVSGFVARGAGPLRGHVVDAKGKPLAQLEVHVVSRGEGERIVKTDASGAYQIELHGKADDASMVFVLDHPGARIDGSSAVTVQTPSDGEAIEIDAIVPPAVVAKPKAPTDRIPDWSDAAMDTNIWLKAWLLLDISDTGKVLRVKLLKHPGYDLDTIAVTAALALELEPARDRADHPMRSMLLWSFEWPAYYWLANHHQSMYRLPADTVMLPCGKPGHQREFERDCERPDMREALRAPWLDARSLAPKK